jgi:hypothetical protein
MKLRHRTSPPQQKEVIMSVIANRPAGIPMQPKASQGTQVNQMLDSLGLPDMVGDLIGAQIDLKNGNLKGYLHNMRDAFSGLPSQAFNQGACQNPFHMRRPSRGIGRSRLLHSHTYSNRGGSTRVERRQLGGRGLAGRLIGRSLERRIMNNPAFRRGMERRLGGRIVLDGRADGKITVVKRHNHNMPGLGFGKIPGHFGRNPLVGGLIGAMHRMDKDLGSLLAQVSGQAAQGLLGQQNSGQVDIGKLVGKGASIEDILAAFLFKQMKSADKELSGLMNKYKALGEGGAKKAGGKGKLFGGIKGLIGKMFKKAGPAGALISKLFGGAAGKSGGNSAGNKAGGKDNKHSKSVMNFKIQQAMNKRKEIHDLISNMLKTMHDMSMTSIRNIR